MKCRECGELLTHEIIKNPVSSFSQYHCKKCDVIYFDNEKEISYSYGCGLVTGVLLIGLIVYLLKYF